MSFREGIEVRGSRLPTASVAIPLQVEQPGTKVNLLAKVANNLANSLRAAELPSVDFTTPAVISASSSGMAARHLVFGRTLGTMLNGVTAQQSGPVRGLATTPGGLASSSGGFQFFSPLGQMLNKRRAPVPGRDRPVFRSSWKSTEATPSEVVRVSEPIPLTTATRSESSSASASTTQTQFAQSLPLTANRSRSVTVEDAPPEDKPLILSASSAVIGSTESISVGATVGASTSAAPTVISSGSESSASAPGSSTESISVGATVGASTSAASMAIASGSESSASAPSSAVASTGVAVDGDTPKTIFVYTPDAAIPQRMAGWKKILIGLSIFSLIVAAVITSHYFTVDKVREGLDSFGSMVRRAFGIK